MPTFDLWALSEKHLMKSVCYGRHFCDLGEELFKVSSVKIVVVSVTGCSHYSLIKRTPRKLSTLNSVKALFTPDAVLWMLLQWELLHCKIHSLSLF